MKHLRYTLVFLLASASLLIISCTGRPHIKSVLDKAEEVMETEDPAVVYAMLDSIDMGELRSRRLKARYALLYSQALDKNYIDLTTDSIIRPAVKYYRRHGSAEDRLKTLYYLGTIKKNAGDNEGAMRCYIEAERFVPKNENLLMSGRLFSAKKAIFYQLYQFHDAEDNAVKAASFFKNAGDTSRYAKELSAALNTSLILNDTAGQAAYIEELKQLIPIMTEPVKSAFYSTLLSAIPTDSTATIKATINEYISTIKKTDAIDWLSVALAYWEIDYIDSALSAVGRYSLYEKRHTSEQRYYLASAYIHESNGDTIQAYDYLKQYVQLDTEERQGIYNDDTKYEDEKFDAELKRIKLTYSLIIAILGAILTGTILMLTLRKTKKREKNLEHSKLQLENTQKKLEKDNLDLQVKYENTLAEFVKNSKNSEMLRNKIEYRMSLFHKLVASYITHDGLSKPVEKELNSLVADKNILMQNLRDYMSAMYPQLISFLKEKQLSEQEIDICNLYLIGLRGKEIGHYLNISRHYIISSDIRKKLGLTEHDTNIDLYLIHLRDQLHERKISN